MTILHPNQPQRGSLPSDPRWGWFGSGAETTASMTQVSTTAEFSLKGVTSSMTQVSCSDLEDLQINTAWDKSVGTPSAMV